MKSRCTRPRLGIADACLIAGSLLLVALDSPSHAQGIAQASITRMFDQKEALKVNEHIYQATGFGNTYLVTTRDGNVIIDTSNGAFGPKHHALLTKVSNAPIRAIILTHAHPDHVGNIARWRGEGTEVIAHRKYPEFREYQKRLAGLFNRRNAAQYALRPNIVRLSSAEILSSRYDATFTFDARHTIRIGELTFELYHTPGETDDQISVWIPELKTAFIGDNYYETFPNIYTLRGTTPRSALDWIHSLETVLSWKPEILLASHMEPILGEEVIQKRLTQYINAIRYVHDKTIEGMNAGKSVHELMREIKLPNELAMNEDYGRLTWSIRGIYEGYVGWFDEDPASMYEVPRSAVDGDLVELAGGPDAVVARGRKRLEGGELVHALHLAQIAIGADQGHVGALELKVDALQGLLARTTNVIEQGWLKEGIRQAEQARKRPEARG